MNISLEEEIKKSGSSASPVNKTWILLALTANQHHQSDDGASQTQFTSVKLKERNELSWNERHEIDLKNNTHLKEQHIMNDA
jgi:hypothetical protein